MEQVINENLKMTKEEVEKYLEEQFANKEFSQWGFAYDVFKVIAAMLPKDFADKLSYETGSRSYGRQALGIKYGKGNACFIGIEVHKKMTKRGNGYKPSSWYHTSAEYVYGKFDIWWMEDNETLAHRMDETVKHNDELIGRAKSEEQKAIEILQHIMDTYQVKDYEARNFCEYISKHFYTLSDLREKLEKKDA